ncbi:hypothetical protein CFC21_008396 [Triticum aestivum]|uniref:Disease resistance protein RPM1 n=2 Tax=Triticum aestivum TaxID=4565 RepID=A0A9R1ISF2_WHEAT|nr:disease resistance protein RGA5-like isoform X1 [Triticum aestivum]KAF6991295.1 hypothetical protein CFC21_008396 [Triticum aestivum]
MEPVVSSTHGTLAPLVAKLTALLADECGRLKGVRREIRSLRSELTSMHAALKEYTKQEDPSDQVKAWISLVRELAYDIEDVFDKFIKRIGKDNHHGGFKDFFRKTARRLKTLGSRRGIANQIDDLKARIRQVKELKNSYKLDDAPCSTSSHAAVDPRLHALFAEEAHLVGVDGPRDDLANWLVKEENSSNKHRRVLSIVGFGGLGKTTLADQVYRKIHGHFHCRAFVSVSQKPDIKKIVKDVISQVSCQDKSKQDISEWDEKKSIAKLRELLQDKRYLIIIDDIWSKPAWDAIKCAFPENSHSSRIIVTTRIVDVARLCSPGSDDRMYEMEVLSDIHSRRLFFKRIFGSEESCPPMLKEISNEILKKCGGLPLAIISISSLLSSRTAVKEEWEKIKRSIGFALEKNQSLETMSTILSLSYNHLPPNLKTCLLYLSIFPEDYIIERERLVRLWIAEGFISEECGQSQQEVAESYFYELINKSMVQPVGIGYDGKARACRVHDMMLEIIVAKSAKDNFVTVVGGGQTSLANHQGFIRRLSVQYIDQELASALASEDLRHVRSLTVTITSGIERLPSLVEFEALRVVDFADCEGLGQYIMNGMEKLIQLRYLRLRGRGISKLPSGIVMLGDLETLDIQYTAVQELPDKIVQLTKLQHLITAGGTKIPDGIGNMMSLRVVTGFNITGSSTHAVEGLRNLTSLDELNVDLDSGKSDEYKSHEEMLLSSLRKLGRCKLQYLQITRIDGSLEFLESWFPLPYSLQKFHMSSSYCFTDVPKWIAPALTSLSYLDINLTELTEEGLHTLGELSALLCLKLCWEKDPEERLTIQGTGFPCLKEFVLSDGAYVTFMEGAMPKLENLRLSVAVSVAKTCGFYLGIEHLTCLKQARIWLDNEDVTTSESKAAAAAVTKEAGAHPNRPIVTIEGRWYEEAAASHEEKNNEDGDN